MDPLEGSQIPSPYLQSARKAEGTGDLREFPLRAEELVAILPAHNEARYLPGVLVGLRRVVRAIVVVDDGSSDDTAQIAQAYGARVLRHASRRGKTEAIRTGLLHAPPSSWVLFMDADGQHDPADAVLLWRMRHGVDAVLGTRDLSARSMPWCRRMANRTMSRVLRGIVGGEAQDTQCGFRLIRREIFAQWLPVGQEYQWESELYGWLLLSGKRLRTVPVRTIYEGSPSRIVWSRDLWGFLCCCRRLLQMKASIARHPHRAGRLGGEHLFSALRAPWRALFSDRSAGKV